MLALMPELLSEIITLNTSQFLMGLTVSLCVLISACVTISGAITGGMIIIPLIFSGMKTVIGYCGLLLYNIGELPVDADPLIIRELYIYLTEILRTVFSLFHVFSGLVNILEALDSSYFDQADQLLEDLLKVLRKLYRLYRFLERQLDINIGDSPLDIAFFEDI